jgi:hypothetical protein
VGSHGAIVFAGPSPSSVRPVTGVGTILATPTRIADDRFVAVEYRADGSGLLLVRRVREETRVLSRTPLPGQSIVGAAASRTHLFVSTAGAFHTFDIETMGESGRFSWVGGGMSPPAIGPGGQVYAIASNILFIFPPP